MSACAGPVSPTANAMTASWSATRCCRSSPGPTSAKAATTKASWFCWGTETSPTCSTVTPNYSSGTVSDFYELSYFISHNQLIAFDNVIITTSFNAFEILFIWFCCLRSAKTLHALEAARAALLPSIVILLQKQWRGALARMHYKKLKAANVIARAWK